ncbi:pilus assembly protein CpaC [Rhodoblastus acidophilus]|uniref:type II and III secretion system protein family protein n=1 Tax=Rhodoblastus acidophilus TaxID=1074 RepID=UPI0022241ED3|nr:type II and III secretion system protein family protein [Rhodoblastus acidophilus]MCW2284686.1 pilus assembly protein CpaC [Rhodoblastus acidophilus]MCW2333639.1 pilus assembly protein CpaC [Rhodoblastus acidophilus]
MRTRPWLVGGLSVLLTLSALALAPARAAGDGETLRFLGENATRRLTMGVGKSVILDLPADAGEIFVGNPAVANAVVRTARKIYVIGQATGQTTIFAMDKQGRRIATLELSIGRDIGELNSILQTALPNSRITARTVNDSIILTGDVDSAADMQTAMDIAKSFVDAMGKAGGSGTGIVVNAITIRGKDQVMIKVTIAEVQRVVTKQLGITASTLAGNWGKFIQDNPFALNGQSYSTGALKTFSNFGGGNTLTQTLQAFERNGVARIMAEPTVTAVSGESAKFTVGGEVPVSSGTNCQGSGAASLCTVGVTYKTYGVTLNFTPVVLSAGRISLRLATEVADIDPATSVSSQTLSAPGFRTRRHETTVELPTGGSIATAGLIQANSNQAINGVPGLMNLPILGSLFRSRDYQRQETELMIIVTPYIAKSVSPNALARPDDNYADSTDPQGWLLGRVNKLYSTADNPAAARHFNGRVGFIHD